MLVRHQGNCPACPFIKMALNRCTISNVYYFYFLIKLKMPSSPLVWLNKWHYVFHCLGIPISEFTQSDLAANSVCYLHTSTEEIYMDSFTFSVTDGKNQVIYYFSSIITSCLTQSVVWLGRLKHSRLLCPLSNSNLWNL